MASGLGDTEWTDLPAAAQGRDHLGMQAPSIALYGSLLPGITNVTLRIRYYTFYPWLCDRYAKRSGRTAKEAWQVFVRRAEALLALASASIEDDGFCQGAAGNRWAQRTWNSSKGPFDVVSASAVGAPGGYLKASFGAFGQVYRNALSELGILAYTENHPIPVPATGRGDLFAAAFARSVGGAGERFLDAMDEPLLDPSSLKDLGRAFSPRRIATDSEECSLLRELLFAEDAPEPGSGTRRRESLRLALHAVSRLRKLPGVMDLRWALYHASLPAGDPLEAPGPLAPTATAWQAYQANELGHVAMEALLRLLLAGLGEEGQATPVREAIESTVEAVRSAWKGPLPADWAALRAGLPEPSHRWDRTSPDAGFKAATRIMSGESDAEEAGADAIRLLAALDRRFPAGGNAVEDTFGREATFGTHHRQSIQGLLEWLRARERMPLPDLLAELLLRQVIERHLRVALRKLHDQEQRTFLFEMEDGALFHRADLAPVWTNPRLETALSFLTDLGLLDARGITDAGREHLEAP